MGGHAVVAGVQTGGHTEVAGRGPIVQSVLKSPSTGLVGGGGGFGMAWVREGGEFRLCGLCPGVGEGWGRVLPDSGDSSMTAG